ncbi:MAG: tetratricopeptide repeat protein [Anaerolineae bacterium]|nr:tetratricopeptide repeat protein [Anaerolineae bacterium]
MMSDLHGFMLGPYRIVEKIGGGGMATVYRAYHPATGREVAIKVLSEHFAAEAQFLARFTREAKVVAGLQHPHILPTLDNGQDRGLTYLVMPHIATGTLRDYLERGPLSLTEARRLFAQIAQAVDYAHRRGVIHRDLKPGNVLLDERGNALLSDFGLARIMETMSLASVSGAMIGTPAYMSPEQAQGLPADARSDIYSLGAVLYEMLTGRPPFSADTTVGLIFKHITEPAPLLRTGRPDLPLAVEQVVLKALAKNPEDRYQTAGAMMAALQQAVYPSGAARRRVSIRRGVQGIALLLAAGLVTVMILIALAGDGLAINPPALPTTADAAAPTTTPEPTRPARSYYDLGQDYYRQGDYEKAIEMYTIALQLDAGFAEAYNGKGQAYAATERYESAIEDYTRAIELDPGMAEAYNNRGIASRRLDDYTQAIEDYSQAITINPDFAEAYNNRGYLYFVQGAYDQAIDDYTRAIELAPGLANAYTSRGYAYYGRGDYRAAIDDYTRAIEIDPGMAEAYTNRCRAYYRLGEYEPAVQDCTRAIEIDPDQPIAYTSRARAYHTLAQYDQAVEDYTHAIRLDSNLAEAYAGRGYTHYVQGDYTSALYDYTRALEIDPNLADVYLSRGYVHFDQGLYAEAIADYTRALEITPDLAEAYARRGRAYHQLEDYTQAFADYERALEIDPSFAPAYQNRAYTFYAQREYHAAIADYTRALEIDPRYAEAYAGLGNVYYDLGRYGEALEQYQHYRSLADAPAQFVLDRLPGLEAQYNDIGSKMVPATGVSRVTVTDPTANLRDGPGTDYAKVGEVQQGDSFPVVAQFGDGSSRWYWIEQADGRRAWIASWLVNAEP